MGAPPLQSLWTEYLRTINVSSYLSLSILSKSKSLQDRRGGLYGRNAVAGAIIITTKKPGRDDWEGAALASIGRGVQARLQASAGGPVVSDRLFLQTSASFLTDNGRRENITLGENVDSVDHDATFRGRLIFEATPTLTLDGRLQYRDFQRGGIKYSVIESGDANDIQQPTSNLLGLSEGDVLNAVLKADLDLSPFTISLISGYTSLNETNEGDLDFSDPVRVPLGAFGTGHSAQFFGYEAKINSHEARLTYVNGDRLIAHVGASILDTDIEFPACLVVDDGSPIEVLEASCTPPNIVFFQDVENNYFAYGVYGQLNYNISDRLSVELAVRYDEDDREQRNCAFDDPSNCDLLSDTFEGLQPKIGIKYDFGDILTYLNCGRAYRSGGFNSPNVPRYRSEQTDTCEVGFKSAWLDNRLIVNGVAFYSDVEDFQFFFLEGFAQRIANIEGAEIWGVEAEIRAQPTDWLNLYAALGTTNTKANESSLFPEFEGNALPRALDYTLNLGGQVRKPINNSTSVFARIDFERRGERTWQIDNLDIQEPVSLLNARIGVEYTDYGVYLFGKNLTDEEFYVDFFPQDFSGRLNAFGDLNQPRIYGVELTATF